MAKHKNSQEAAKKQSSSDGMPMSNREGMVAYVNMAGPISNELVCACLADVVEVYRQWASAATD